MENTTEQQEELKQPVIKPTPDAAKSVPEKTENPNLSKYEFYPDFEVRKEMVDICVKVADYLYRGNFPNLILVDRGARPACLGIKEVWNRKYPDRPVPKVYYINPTGFVSAEQAYERNDHGVQKGAEIMMKGLDDNNFTGDYSTDARSREEIQKNFEESYYNHELRDDKDNPLFLFDVCIHSGGAIAPIMQTLKNAGFTNVKLGLASADRNTSDIHPDFVAVNGKPEGGCYPFDRDRMIIKRFDSISSKLTGDKIIRERARKQRREILRIFQEAPAEWYGMTPPATATNPKEV
jgi:hypothetical protein